MSRHKQKPPRRYRQLKDDYPLVRAMRIEQASNISIPGEGDIEREKNWADHNQR